MAGEYAAMRASDEDRARVQSHLNEAFAEGRLDQQEWDERATALVSGLCGFVFGVPASIAAIILGHKARRQIVMIGEQGSGRAQAGLILGYVGIAIALVGVLAVAFASSAPALHR